MQHRGVRCKPRGLCRGHETLASPSVVALFLTLLYHISPLAILFFCLVRKDISGHSRVSWKARWGGTAPWQLIFLPLNVCVCVWGEVHACNQPVALSLKIHSPHSLSRAAHTATRAFTTSVFVVCDGIQMGCLEHPCRRVWASHMENRKEIFKGALHQGHVKISDTWFICSLISLF